MIAMKLFKDPDMMVYYGSKELIHQHLLHFCYFKQSVQSIRITYGSYMTSVQANWVLDPRQPCKNCTAGV